MNDSLTLYSSAGTAAKPFLSLLLYDKRTAVLQISRVLGSCAAVVAFSGLIAAVSGVDPRQPVTFGILVAWLALVTIIPVAICVAILYGWLYERSRVIVSEQGIAVGKKSYPWGQVSNLQLTTVGTEEKLIVQFWGPSIGGRRFPVVGKIDQETIETAMRDVRRFLIASNLPTRVE